ncbi:GNAT family N-acetyltransferase [Paenibacillus filicis]|uniref:GNAT family N-acetyltransferase n=1 Tax=Paenibacillus filicis TaxID=669464 RepID=A0ABU9DGI4_9BACL
MNIEIVPVRSRPELLEAAISYFWEKWGSETSYRFYRNCIEHSCTTKSDLPRFYIAMDEERIIGSYALLRSDLNSRQDLAPWFACLYVDQDYRGERVGALLQQHAVQESREFGYQQLYLCTDLTGYYERTGWSYIGEGYSLNDDETRVYAYTV